MGISGVQVKREKSDIIDAIHKKMGIIDHAAKLLECHRDTIYTWMKEDEDIANAVMEARAYRKKISEDEDCELVMLARQAIKSKLVDGDVTSIIFTLKCKDNWAHSEPASQADAQQAFTALARKQYSQI